VVVFHCMAGRIRGNRKQGHQPKAFGWSPFIETRGSPLEHFLSPVRVLLPSRLRAACQSSPHLPSRFPIPCSWAVHSVRSSLSSKMRNYESACFTCAGGLVRHTRTQCLRVRRCAYLSLNPRSLGTCSLDLTPPLHSTPIHCPLATRQILN